MIPSSAANLQLLEQGQTLIGQLTARQFSVKLDILEGATLGQHFRHIYDFYACLLRDRCLSKIDYAERDRQSLIEENPQICQTFYSDLIQKLLEIKQDQPLQVLSDFSASESEQRILVHSSLARELMYAFDHTIHHYAIIKIGLVSNFPDKQIPENFGVAPSTQKHRAKAGAMPVNHSN